MSAHAASLRFAVLLAMILSLAVGCSSGGGAPAGPGNGPVTGGTFGTGDFRVTIAPDSIPQSAKAAPVATAEAAVPGALPIDSDETNVTSQAKAYTLRLGEAGFQTSTVGSVRLEIPFIPAAVPEQAKLDSLHVVLRILNADDGSVIDINGFIDGNKIVAELTGFPSSATMVAVFSPGMREVVSDETAAPVRGAARATSASASAWPTTSFVCVYREKEVKDAVEFFLGRAATSTEIAQALKSEIVDHAADAAKRYEAAGFRAPLLYMATKPQELGGSKYGSLPRYYIHYRRKWRSAYAPARLHHEVVTPEGDHYGRIFIGKEDINFRRSTMGQGVYGTIAHELLHAVQRAYGIDSVPPDYLKGVREGTSTAYGALLDLRHDEGPLAVPPVRTWMVSPEPPDTASDWTKWETYVLAGALLDPWRPYANQDFFVYLARTIGNNDYGYLTGFFEQLRVTTSTAPAPPAAPAIRKALDMALGTPLPDVYGEFVRQRAMEHNAASRFGRDGETEVGLAAELFDSAGSLVEAQIDPTSSTPTRIETLTPMKSLSARAIRIAPAMGTSTGDLTIKLTPSVGTFGTTLSGWAYFNNGPANKLDATTEVSGFGSSGSDELVLLLINPSFEDAPVTVTCEITGKENVTSKTIKGMFADAAPLEFAYDPYDYVGRYASEMPKAQLSWSGSWQLTGGNAVTVCEDPTGDSQDLCKHVKDEHYRAVASVTKGSPAQLVVNVNVGSLAGGRIRLKLGAPSIGYYEFEWKPTLTAIDPPDPVVWKEFASQLAIDLPLDYGGSFDVLVYVRAQWVCDYFQFDEPVHTYDLAGEFSFLAARISVTSK